MKVERLLRVIMAAVLCVAAGAAWAGYPDHAIRLVVPSGAGGVTDSLARSLARELSVNLGQDVFVDNRPGASGIVGTKFVASAPPDGYTLLMVFPSHVANPSLFSNLPYDTVKSFAPVSLVSNVSMVFVVNQVSPANTLAQFMAYARARPGKLNFASVGSGSLGHLGAELFNTMAGTHIVHVPYKGSPQAMTALLANEVDMYLVASASSVVPLIKSGQVKALGVSTKERLPILPDTPAIAEALPGYDVSGWNGILAPAGTPAAVIERLHEAVVKSVRAPAFKRILEREGATGVASTPAEFDATIKSDIAKWAKVISDAGIKKN